MQFRKKPVVVNAFKWTYDVVPDWWRNLTGVTIDVATESAFIPTLEGTMEARKGDFIIQGVNGENYPCKPDIFAKTYEPVSAPLLQEAAEWVREKPDFKEECTFVTANKYHRNKEDLDFDFSVWQIKKLDGENDEGEDIWYWGLLNGDGEEWGPLEDLEAMFYLILPAPPTKNT